MRADAGGDARWLAASERLLRVLLRLYPADFREEMGPALVETYLDRCRAAWRAGGASALLAVWARALVDSLHNGVGERMRPGVTWRRTGDWGRDAERVVKRLVRAPLFVLSMVGTLAVGLGAFAVVAAVVQNVLLAPLPFPRSEDLHVVWRNYTWVPLERGWLAGTDVAALQQAGGPIEAAAALDLGAATVSGDEGGAPQEIALLASSANLFDLLGAKPALGRTFAPEEEGPGRPAVVVLGHTLWRDRFGADAGIVGKQVRLDGTPHTVIGVMGRDFRFARQASMGAPQAADAYVTFDQALSATSPFDGSYGALVRARPGTSPAVLQQAVGAVARVVDERDMKGRGLRLEVKGAKEDLVAPVRPALRVLGAAGALLVLVLAVNLATLLLVRASQREREFAICRALGADPLVVARATLLEGGLLGVLGGALGALGATWVLQVLVGLAPADLPRRDSIEMTWGLAALVTGVGGLMGLAAGALPAVWGARAGLETLLGNGSTRAHGGRGRMRRSMVVLQVALALVLLGTGGLVARSFERLLAAQPGFATSGVLTLRIPLTGAASESDAAVYASQERLQRELAALPGVEAVGATTALPLTANANQTDIGFPGAPGNTGVAERDNPLVDTAYTQPGYFEAMGIRVLEGRVFSGAPRDDVREVVIDRTLAERFFPGGGAVGAKAGFERGEVRVIGVVDHARYYDVYRDGRGQVYLQNSPKAAAGALSWALRTRRDADALVPEVRAAVARVDAGLPLSEVRTVEALVDGSLQQQKLSAVLLGGFSLGALLLAAMGLYGVVAGTVQRRRHELAVRLALGADRRSVVGLVLREGAWLVGLGLVVGVPGLYFMARAAGAVLVGISAFDPLTLGAVALGLGGVALLACWVPARRVAGIDPAGALRQE